jgi:hypothetical protein
MLLDIIVKLSVTQSGTHTAQQRIIVKNELQLARHKTRTGSIYLEVDRGATLEGSKK